ncbi:hypothetical protein WJX84_003865 [Apatococcus fuscideae]|uniref:Uncharacterized protein n=1 Tax=Apatococcus fuscideae TaxID=2026836 RepID=A0AAW1SP27_9CHLO
MHGVSVESAPVLQFCRQCTQGLALSLLHERTVLGGQQMRPHICCASVNASASDGRIKYLYDGGCKVCQTFKSSLQAQEGNKDRINYVNIAEDSYSPQENNDVSYDDAMSTIHAISADGKTVKGPDAVKELFGEAGSTTDFLAKAADQPGFDQLFGSAYDFMSKNRFQISDAATKAKKAVGAE